MVKKLGFEFDDRRIPNVGFEELNIEEDQMKQLINGFSQYAASVLSVRCDIRIRNNLQLVCTAEDRSLHEVRVRCNCSRCRGAFRKAWVENGSDVYSTLYRSSNPEYLPNAENDRILKLLNATSDDVARSLSLCEIMENASSQALLRGENCRLDPAVISELPAWTQETRYGTYTTGRLGHKLWDEIYKKTVDFFVDTDNCICKAYNIPINTSRECEEHVRHTFNALAARLANKLTFVENVKCFGPIDTSMCEAINKREFERSRRNCQEDWAKQKRAVENLKVLAIGSDTDRIRSLMNNEDFSAIDIMNILQRPPPEFSQAMTKLNLNPGMLSFTLFEAAFHVDNFNYDVRKTVLDQWRNRELNGIRLQLVCERTLQIMKSTEGDTSVFFIKIATPVDPLNGCNDPSLILPEIPWCHNYHMWKLEDLSVHLKRRIRLDSVGMRIVFVSSFVWQLLGQIDPAEIDDGLFSPEMLHTISFMEMINARSMRRVIKEDRQKLTVGDEFQATKNQLLSWRSSHFQDSIRAGIANLSHFSLKQIIQAFHPDSPTGLSTTLSDNVLSCLPYKPKTIFKEFVAPIIDVLLTMVADARTEAGMGLLTSSCNIIAEHFTANTYVQQWNQVDELVLFPWQVDASFLKLLHSLAKEHKLVQWVRPWTGSGKKRKRSNWCFMFDNIGIRKILRDYKVYTDRLQHNRLE